MATNEPVDPRAPIEGEWNRMPQWTCPICGWDTLDEPLMTAHLDPVTGRHLPPYVPPPPEAEAEAEVPTTEPAPEPPPDDAAAPAAETDAKPARAAKEK